MPFLCCNASQNDVVTRDQPPTKDGNNPNISQQQQHEKDENEPTREERELARSIYHDARQSLTDSMVYRPARSMMAHQTFNLDSDPSDLLASPTAGGVKDSVVVVTQRLRAKGLVQAGYPGSLTDAELEACLDFRKQVKEKRGEEPTYFEMVHIFQSFEPEAFALCRAMRSRHFNVDHVFALLAHNLQNWKKAQVHDFYPELQSDEGMGSSCSLSALYSQLPLLHSGMAKNGSLVFYFPVADISLEALDCLTDLENFEKFFWNLLVHSYGDYAKVLQKHYPNKTILAELTMVIDLKGLKRSLFTSRVIEVLKKVMLVLNCFPEALSKSVIMNAPFFFSAIWVIFRNLMDARTQAKIDIYSTEKPAMACLRDHIDDSELLSDYGGSGPSYEDVLHKLRHPGTTRQEVHRVFSEHHNKQLEAKCEFDLTANEKATLLVFTRSTTGAHFTVSKGGGAIRLKEVPVKPTDVASNQTHSQPYVQELVSELKGPGQFVVAAKGNNPQSKQYFLVQVLVYAM